MRGEEQIIGRAVVCVLERDATEFADNEIGRCHFCDRRVQYRPHVPTPRTLVCRICFVDRMEDGDEVEITPRSVAEFAKFLRRN